MRQRAFTLAELLVAAGILAVMIISVGIVFRVTSAASGIAEADTNVLEKLRVLDQALRGDIENHLATSHGLLIVHAQIAPSVESEFGGVPRLARVDRLAMTARGQYESATALLPTGRPATSDAALILYGHGHPGRIVSPPGGDITPARRADDPPAGPRVDWVLCRRALLLLGVVDPSILDSLVYTFGQRPVPSLVPGPTLQWERNHQHLFQGRTDSLQVDLAGLVRGFDPPVPPFQPGNANNNLQGVYYGRSLVPETVTADTHRRAFPVMLPNVGDFLVEWTDGSFVDPRDVQPFDGNPDDTRVQWFGLPRDTNGDGQITPFSGDTMTKVDWLFGNDHEFGTMDDRGTAEAFTAYTGLSAATGAAVETPIENFPFNPSSPYRPQGSLSDYYHASWFSTSSQWRFRPTAFRIVVRLYDSELRVGASTDERAPTVDAYTLTAMPQGSDLYGSQFTIVAP